MAGRLGEELTRLDGELKRLATAAMPEAEPARPGRMITKGEE
jgi:hypothetical protein